MKVIKVATGIITNSREEALLQKKDSGYHWHPNQWCFFGGQVERGEKPLDAFMRELEEELGLQLKEVKFFGEYTLQDVSAHTNEIRRGRIYVHQARFTGNILDIRLKEGSGFGFFSRQEIETLPIVWHNKRALIDYYNKS